jgi:BON domain-containing protein
LLARAGGNSRGMNPTSNLIRQGVGLARGAVGQATRLGLKAASQAWELGRGGRPAPSSPPAPKDLDDVTLARKVESEVFRDDAVPKASIDVNVVDGVVELRGQVKRPQDKASVEARVRAVPEVKGVENMLHLPKTPAPTRADAPGRQRAAAKPKPKRARAAAAKPRTAKPRARPKVTSDDQTDRIIPEGEREESPSELAREGKGRQPAPLGSSGSGTGNSGAGGGADSPAKGSGPARPGSGGST